MQQVTNVIRFQNKVIKVNKKPNVSKTQKVNKTQQVNKTQRVNKIQNVNKRHMVNKGKDIVHKCCQNQSGFYFVAAIDLGTSTTGCGYSTTTGFESNPLNISCELIWNAHG